MSRPRGDRAASKGRPRRRAAATHLFKYQLAGNPNRAEENAIKKALQESMEDTFINDGKKRSKIIVNSASNSDVSKSNNSSSSSNESAGSISISLGKRTRSSNGPTISSTPLGKRARLSNGPERSNKSDHLLRNGHLTPTITPTLLQTGKAIKTYSKSQPDLVLQHNPKQSTPSLNNSDKEAKSKSSSQTSVSRSTQTAPVCSKKNQLANKSISNVVNPPISSNLLATTNSTDTAVPPVQEQYLKSKRESKNYAYAKMTALKVNTSKSPASNSKSNIKKTSPNGILNNSSTNKDAATRVSPKGNSSNGHLNNLTSDPDPAKKTANCTPNIVSRYQGKSSTSKSETSTGKKSPSNTSSRAGHNNSKNTDNPGKVSKVSNVQTSQNDKTGISRQNVDMNTGDEHPTNDCLVDDTVDLSNKKNQNQANIKQTKKRPPHGSWSLLGVPEEKVIFLRDDEPPRRMICYPAIKHIEGDVIQIRDSVLLRSGARKTDLPYIAKVCAFWEDAETGGVMMSLFWYYRPEHTEEGRKPHQLIDEVFASRHRDVDSVECIEDKCYVLTYNEYCRYRKRCKMEQVNTTWSLADVTIPVSNESYPRRNRIPDSDVNPELVFCCRQIYDSRMRKLIKNPLINPKYGHI